MFPPGCAARRRSLAGMNITGDSSLIPALAWSCRPDGTTEFLNRRWLDYTGLSLEEALGWGWKVAIHPEDLGKLMATWLGLLASGEPGEEEARLRRFDGEYRWFLFRAVPIRDDQGVVVRWYGTNTEIEDRKRAESLLSAEKRTLEMIAGGASLTNILENLCSTGRSRYIGSHSSLQLEWRLDRHISLTTIYLHFFPGPFLKETQPGRNVDFVALWVTYKF